MPTTTFERLSEEKKERILRCAITEFHEHGFEKAKVETIAKAANIAKGSIYQYFEDKKELFLYAVDWSVEYFMRKIDALTPLEGMDVFDYFLSGSQGRYELLKEEPLLAAFSFDVYGGRFADLTRDIRDVYERVGNKYEIKLIENGQKKGTIRTDIDTEALLLYFQGIADKISSYALKIGISKDSEEEKLQRANKMMAQMIALLKNGMEA